jgi:glucokinase
MVGELRASAARKGVGVAGVGIAVPGIATRETGDVWAPNIRGWEKYPLKREIEASLGARIPVLVDNDRACAILGERWRGAARGCDHAIFIAVGTGIGLGVLANGRVLRGAHDIAGATGWMALTRPFRDGYGACGCFEYAASGDGLARVAADLLGEMPEYTGELRLIPPHQLTARDLFGAYDRNDPLARRVIEQAIHYWGMATANYVSLFDPDRIIFGGGVFGPAIRFLPLIRREAERWAQPISMKLVELVPAELGPDAVLVGAGSRARSAPDGASEDR